MCVYQRHWLFPQWQAMHNWLCDLVIAKILQCISVHQVIDDGRPDQTLPFKR